MQMLGKQLLEENKEIMEAEEMEEALFDEEGTKVLCERIAKRRVPVWLQKTGNFFYQNRRHFVIVLSAAVIGFAVYLNWALYEGQDLTDADKVSAGTSLSDITKGTENVGDNVSVSAEEKAIEDYFAVSQINRQRARDEAIEVLQTVADGAANLSDVQNEALAEIAKIATDIENEAAIESLIKGKGFSQCVAVISGNSANVIVRSSALLPNEITQILEIVYETAGILPQNVKIIEK